MHHLHQTHLSPFPNAFPKRLLPPKPLYLGHPRTGMTKLRFRVLPMARLVTETDSKSTMYDLLSVQETAGLEEIKAAYRKVARQWNPDTCRSKNKEFCTQQFIKAREAYKVLSDPVLREDYDYGLQNGFDDKGIFFRKGDGRKNNDFDDWESQLEGLKSRSNCRNSSWGSRMRAKHNQQ